MFLYLKGEAGDLLARIWKGSLSLGLFSSIVAAFVLRCS